MFILLQMLPRSDDSTACHASIPNKHLHANLAPTVLYFFFVVHSILREDFFCHARVLSMSVIRQSPQAFNK